MWSRAATDMTCKNSVRQQSVSTQQECQDICVESSTCHGIAYSYKRSSARYCYLCDNDDLIITNNKLGFYRKLGTSIYYYENKISRE